MDIKNLAKISDSFEKETESRFFLIEINASGLKDQCN